MTSGSAAGLDRARLIVVGVDTDGVEVARLALGHGDDPTVLLAGHGWAVRRVWDVLTHPVDKHRLTLTFVVEPSLAEPLLAGPRVAAPLTTGAQPAEVRPAEVRPAEVRPRSFAADDDLVTLEGEVALRHQRVAAYAVVTSSRGLLMTQFSDRTNAAGQWGLPGGGLEPGEEPDRAVLREVWEESGQLVELSGLAMVQTGHWVGRAPAGKLEDYHAVRVIYRAVCPEPTEPVVHDVGGTTAFAAWMLPAEVDLLALTSSWRAVLDVVMAPDETDGPEHRHHDTDADDRARPQP